MSKKPRPYLPVHRSVRVTSSSVVEILDAHYGIQADSKLITAWYRRGLLPGSKAGEGKKSAILFEVGAIFDAADKGDIPPRAKKATE